VNSTVFPLLYRECAVYQCFDAAFFDDTGCIEVGILGKTAALTDK